MGSRPLLKEISLRVALERERSERCVEVVVVNSRDSVRGNSEAYDCISESRQSAGVQETP